MGAVTLTALGIWVALLAPTPPGPLVVFWSNGRTYIVDVEAERLLEASGWITSTPAGLWRYRLRVDADRARRKPGEPMPPASRWTVFEQLAPAAAAWEPLTPVPTRPRDGSISDETHVVQFAGDRVTLARHFRRRSAAHPTPTTPSPTALTRRAEAFTLALPGGEREPLPTETDAALDWLRRALPGVLDPCVDRPIGAIALDLPGGRLARWLVVRGEAEACAGAAHALRLDRPAPALAGAALVGARWVDEAIVTDDGARLDAVVDVRPDPSGWALVLRGAPLPIDAPIHRELMSLDDPCEGREVLLYHPGRDPRRLGTAARLDGARALAADDPLRAALATRFRPADAPPCHSPLPLDAAPIDVTHACRLDETARPWRGPADLAAAISARFDGGRLHVELAITDPERAPGDGVRLYLGPGRRPTTLAIAADGAIKAHPRRARVAVAADATAEGYRLHLAIERALLGDPPAITLAIDDADPALPGVARLWAAGAPIDARNPAATGIGR